MEGITTINMPSQIITIEYTVVDTTDMLNIITKYWHPTEGLAREIYRRPLKRTFSQKHFRKEVEAYIVQEAMADLMDCRHSCDWVE